LVQKAVIERGQAKVAEDWKESKFAEEIDNTW